MQTEIEAKFLRADHDALRKKLQAIGAVCEQPMRLMRRNNFDFPDQRLRKDHNGWARARDEGNKITLSYKQLNDRTLHGTKEVCIAIDDFDQGVALFKSLGLEPTSYQETKRESWRLDDVEIELDHWPWTQPYVEIEAPSEEHLRAVVDRLGLDWKEAVYGSVEVVYRGEYDVTDDQVNAIKTITFELPVPSVLAEKKRA